MPSEELSEDNNSRAELVDWIENLDRHPAGATSQ